MIYTILKSTVKVSKFDIVILIVKEEALKGKEINKK